MLVLQNITKKFGSNPVYTISSLELAPGLYWIKGANGSGKSTFLKMLAGLLPFSGEIKMDAVSIHKEPVKYRAAINYAAAEPIYPSFLRGTELLNYVSQLKKGNDQQANQLKEALGIDSYLDNPTGSYSSGMLKKLSLLLAFTGNPTWILLDEPFTTLDQASQQSLTKLIRQKREDGISFILTSHHDIDLSSLSFSAVYRMEEQQLKYLS